MVIVLWHFEDMQEHPFNIAYTQVIEDWKYVSVVLDRIFLITFTVKTKDHNHNQSIRGICQIIFYFKVVCFLGCVLIIFRAPTIYDRTPALGKA